MKKPKARAAAPFADWDEEPAGTIKVFPVTGWATAMAFETTVALRLVYAGTPGELTKNLLALQLLLGPQQALDLADELTRLATHILALRPADGRKN